MHTSVSPTPTKFDDNHEVKKIKEIKKMSESSKSSKGTYQAIKSCDADSSTSAVATKKSKKKGGVHLNNLWSIWYGVFCTGVQGYLAYKCLKKILGYSVLSWPDGLPYFELNCSLGLNGAVFLLLPIFFSVAILKIGNLANDGYKLGRQMSMCSREPPEILTTGGGCGLFRYGGPTAPFIHIAISFCLLIPKLLMEAKMIEAGFLPQEYVWHTDLDFLISHRDRSVVLSFVSPSSANFTPSPAPLTVDQANTKPDAMAFTSANVTHTVMKTLKDIIGHENHTFEVTDSEGPLGSSLSLEYINLVLALVIYSIRYPALFWSTNKCLGLIFSFQLLINGLHTIISYSGMSILYKIHVANLWTSLPLLQHSPRLYKNFDRATPFLLNAEVTFALFMLSTLLVLASSVVMYFYGHTRFTSFLNRQRDKKLITLKTSSGNAWTYFTHCAAFCVLISIGICNAPLIHDHTVVYRGSLDDVTLICIIAGILHLFFWIVIWLFLTVKQAWTFKIRITIGQATVRESRSLRLVHDVHLSNHRTEETVQQQPLLVIGNGRTYTVSETSPKKAIMGVIQKAALIKKSKSNGSITTNDDSDDQIYWLRPALVPSLNSPDSSKYFCWFKKRPKQKVTFNELSNTTITRNKSSVRRSVIPGMDEDDGDYATLRELPLPPSVSQRLSNGEDTASEEGKLLACVHDEHITYASTNQDFTPPVVYEDPSPLLEPVVVHTNFETPQTSGSVRILRRSDSGIMAHEELPGRSDSISTECSASPPEPPGSSHSESSSGVHSNDSTDPPSVIKQPLTKIDWKSSDTDNCQAANLINLDVESQQPESTVVIRRKSIRPNPNEGVPDAILKEDPYGRATNMRMTSFTDHKGIQSSSATLPHYPTQPSIQNAYPNCSTMPLPQHTSGNIPQPMTNGNSCNIYTNRQHSTIPTHLNGVKIVTSNHNPYSRIRQSGEPISAKLEPIYTKINRNTNEICHYSTTNS
ncbi:protein tincar isoform X3 [Sitophilus oryzae]|uniref:Protein tincar isoform X1 n=1 Tax=Sitophilus oryzae TaxID=7048 RepID=A0A6J2YYK9_SITOR|nr:protein tincar isoform X1 [Sitophilus oryzae]XP_030768320.1 protein tincar isoform X1 [Sitophilus oryzae]XP_030768321.1 protein tincar isoform X1 [Sitophilus oryzae]XP_030768322.1 protein tincar isoform X3 [Sitophilus oryzae]